MSRSKIVLTDDKDIAVDFLLQHIAGDRATYVHNESGGSLLGAETVELRIVRRPKLNRVHAKLSIPVVCTDSPCGTETVQLTEVGSLDVSSVLAAPQQVRERFAALLSSLASSEAMTDAIVDGNFPV